MNKQQLLDCWTMFRREHENVSVDRMLCTPELRSKFVTAVQENFPGVEEKEALWVLTNLRKAKRIKTNEA